MEYGIILRFRTYYQTDRKNDHEVGNNSYDVPGPKAELTLDLLVDGSRRLLATVT